MKKLLTLFIAFMASTCLWADGDFQVGNLKYNITSESTVAVERYYESSGDSDITSVTIPSTVTYEGKTYSVTSIGDCAFYYCKALTSITIPDGVTSIGYHAFYSCDALTSITIPCTMETLGYEAIDKYRNDLTIIITANSIEEYCQSLINLKLIERKYFQRRKLVIAGKEVKDLVIPSSVKSIAKKAFADCKSLTSVTISEGVTSIGDGAFKECAALTSVTIPNSVTSIGVGAFRNCESLTTITIPESVTSIGTRTFSGCDALKSINIPNSVTSIGEEAFYGCKALKSINVPNSITSIGAWAFSGTAFYDNPSNWENGVLYINGCLIEVKDDLAGHFKIKDDTRLIGGAAFAGCNSLTSITIPESITSIKNHVFFGCTALQSITIPKSVKSIGEDAFCNCKSLISITIPESVTNIGGAAFSGCTALTSITIPDGVTSIGAWAFSGCTALQSITIPSSVTSIGGEAFGRTAFYDNPSNWEDGGLYINGCLIRVKYDLAGKTKTYLSPGSSQHFTEGMGAWNRGQT